MAQTKARTSVKDKEWQMRWTPRGARLLLHVRTHVLNNSSPATSAAGTRLRQVPDPAALTA